MQADAVWSFDGTLYRLGDVPRPLDPEERQFARDLGAAINAKRLEADVSQEELAEAAGASVGTLGRWERGVNPPKSYQLAKIWRRLNRPDARWFFDPPDSMSETDREIAAAVEEGRQAAYRPRRRATRRASVERGVHRPRPQKPSPPRQKTA